MGDPRDVGDPREVVACFEALPAAVWAFEGPEHRVVVANRAARAGVGNRAGMLGLPARLAIPEAAGARLVEQLDQVYATGEPSARTPLRDFVLLPRLAEDGSVRGVLAYSAADTPGLTQLVLTQPVPAQPVLGRPVPARSGEAAAVAVAEPGPQPPVAPDAALTLQRVMLPAGLPVLPQVWMAAQYVVAGDDLAAGGDWFDAIPLGRGRVALTVGDVVGRGPAAAAVMGQLRTVLTEALLDGVPAAEALARLNRYASRVPPARAATACLAVIDPIVGRVEYGGFAHPAPLVVGEGGRTRFLPLPPSCPLGLGPEPSTLHTARLTAGEVLLLYSDGLVERPGRSRSEAMAELASVAAAAAWDNSTIPAPGPVADRVCGLALERLTRSGCYADDVTLLAAEMRLEPHRPLALELPAEGIWLRGIRRALDEWLHGVGATGDDVPAVHLAVIEAATNCVEHAYQDEPGWMWIDAVLDGDGWLRVTVTDHGQWRPPPPDPERRGRGLRLMHSLMESVDVHRSDRGTTVTMARTLRHPTVLSAVRSPARLAPNAEFATEARLAARPCLVVTGPVDITTAGSLRNRISELSHGGVLPVDIDLGAVTHLASAGVQVLYECARTAHPGWVRLLVPPGSPARLVLKLTGLEGALQVLSEPPVY